MSNDNLDDNFKCAYNLVQLLKTIKETRDITMINKIDAILFDMGGTLRHNDRRDETSKANILQQILDLVKSEMTAVEFSQVLTTRERAYEDWATGNLVELDEIGLWTEWMMPEWPKEFIRSHAMELNEIWRDAICTRAVFPETVPTILGLHKNGYRLGLVSNTTSSVDSPRTLEAEGISRYFKTVVLSCLVGTRKPAPEILLMAAEKIGVLPIFCAYVGDRPDWDVAAARAAGFGCTIVLRNPKRPFAETLPVGQTPDYFINTLLELLELFPSKKA